MSSGGRAAACKLFADDIRRHLTATPAESSKLPREKVQTLSARHRAEVCEQGRRKSRLGCVERRNEAALSGLDGATEIKCSAFGDNIIAHM